jgi:hypothetical protein
MGYNIVVRWKSTSVLDELCLLPADFLLSLMEPTSSYKTLVYLEVFSLILISYIKLLHYNLCLSGYCECVQKTTRKQYLIFILVIFAMSGIIFVDHLCA